MLCLLVDVVELMLMLLVVDLKCVVVDVDYGYRCWGIHVNHHGVHYEVQDSYEIYKLDSISPSQEIPICR